MIYDFVLMILDVTLISKNKHNSYKNMVSANNVTALKKKKTITIADVEEPITSQNY